MAHITVDGETYEVNENLGYQPSAHYYAKIVRVGEAYRSAVSRSRRGPWRWWTSSDALLHGSPTTIGQEA